MHKLTSLEPTEKIYKRLHDPALIEYLPFGPQKNYNAIKSVTIDWSMADTTNITGYKMYYSCSSDITLRWSASFADKAI